MRLEKSEADSLAKSLSDASGRDLKISQDAGSSGSKGALQSIFLGSVEDLAPFFADVPCVLYECDSSLRVTRISANAANIIGMAPKELIGSRHLLKERVFSPDRADLSSRLEKLRLGQSDALTHRCVDDYGLPVWVSHSFKKVNSPRGEVIRGSFVPLAAETYMRSIDANIIPQFVHKIGNHFQLINLLIGNLRQGNFATPELDNLQQALDETVEFTRAFLNYAQVPSCSSEFELGEVLNTVIESMLPVFVEKRIALRNLVDDFAGVSVLGDPLLLEEAFKSILQNANDATKPEDEVTVRAIRERHPRGRRAAAMIIITDTGCGMDEHVLAQAVNPFFTSRHDRGGLGLSFAARIIELHGGSLRLSSTERQGAQIEIMLPASIGNQRSARRES